MNSAAKWSRSTQVVVAACTVLGAIIIAFTIYFLSQDDSVRTADSANLERPLQEDLDATSLPNLPTIPEPSNSSSSVSSETKTSSTEAGTSTETSTPKTPENSAKANEAMIKAFDARNKNHDTSSYADTPSVDLPIDKLTVSWRDYQADGITSVIQGSGAFRVECEFSHLAYDDPIIFPNEPGVSHLHMFFGNTDANAYSTGDSLLNSGSSTCNGQELNRTSYWVPAMIDKNGNIPIPDELLVYYKAYGPAIGSTEVYPENMQLVSGNPMATTPQPGTANNRELFFRCHVRGIPTNDSLKSVEIPTCGANARLEMNIKFQTCWNGKDSSNFRENASFSNVWPTSGECPSSHPRKLPQMEYRIFFSDHSGSKDWFLSSDVSVKDQKTINSNGYSLHGDWFGGWNKEINQRWVDNCLNIVDTDCDEGLLSDSHRDQNAMGLKIRPEYNGPQSVSGKEVLSKLCKAQKEYSGPPSVALCNASMMHNM